MPKQHRDAVGAPAGPHGIAAAPNGRSRTGGALSLPDGADVAALVRTASRDQLAAVWQCAYRRPPPAGLSRRLLEYAAAWHLQAERYGGLKPEAKRKLKRLAAQHARDSGARSPEPGQPDRAKPRPALAPGTRLIREWGGRSHVVDVVEGGCLYQGRHYGSLSEVARAITGARWSGPRFFGLDKPAKG